MPYAYCPRCNVAYHWFAGKGFRLKFLRCPRCKGELRRCTYEQALKCKEIDERLYEDWGWRTCEWEI